MELGIHIRSMHQASVIRRVPEHLATLYAQREDWSALVAQDSLRIYVGDEFCVHRLPRLDELDDLVQSANARQWQVSFLTPPLTDQGLERCARLFDYLQQKLPQTEVVVNDWGVLSFLKENYPSFQLSVGRLLNKGFKDPRLSDATSASRFSAETAALFNRSTFDFAALQQKLFELQVRRLERDVLPYEDLEIERLKGLSTSVYFPFGYITTGRICWIASFNETEGKKFCISDGCQRSCNEISLKLKHNRVSLEIRQDGNTVFYLYPPEKLRRLLLTAEQNKIRLIYQGLVICNSQSS